MKITNYPSQDEIKSLVEYDPLTGIFTWKKRNEAGFHLGGKKAGWKDGLYLRIKIHDKCYLAHRLAYIYMYGDLGLSEIDHINRKTLDNRIDNLRLANREVNTRNRNLSKNNKSGVTGVCFNKSHKLWVSSITVNGKKKELCSRKNFNEAVMKRYEAEIEHGYSAINPRSTAYQYLQEITS